MKAILGLSLFFLISCMAKQNANTVKSYINSSQQDNLIKSQDSLFTLEFNENDNFVKINASKELSFSLPDSSIQTEPYKFGDFNADGKEDVLLYFGACGTGGCMYGLFLKQFENKYKLAFMDYLKNAEFESAPKRPWIIKSYEELEAYDPSKLQVSVFKFDTRTYYYKLDTTFICPNK